MSLTLEKVEFLSLLEFSLSERRINCKQFSAPKIIKGNGKKITLFTLNALKFNQKSVLKEKKLIHNLCTTTKGTQNWLFLYDNNKCKNGLTGISNRKPSKIYIC
jgi:hypothetical protein